MTAVEIYERENKQPSNQISHHEWYIDYIKWLEEQVVYLYGALSVCSCCGSDKTYITRAVHCNRCSTTQEV